MKKVPLLLCVFICLQLNSLISEGQVSNTRDEVTIKIDASKKLQRIEGLGVNVNTRSWNGKELEPALNLFLDSMKFNIWRVIVETVEKWEEVNDNNDPLIFNWDYFNKLYETEKFQRAWGLISYLNNHGITDKLMINFMGIVPQWMGGEYIKPEYEDEYIEMLVSFFYYARNTKHLQFGLVSLMNEPDIHKEGPTVDAKQYVRLLKKLIERMKELGLGDVRYVAPDVAGMENGIEKYMPAIMNDSAVMEKISRFGLHSYAGYYANADSAIKHSPYPKTGFWITEWNAWRDGLDDGKIGVYDYKFASQSISYLLDLLKNGASAALIWEGYDSYYEHHAPSLFSYWGILGYDAGKKVYTPRKHFYAIGQVSKFIEPGSWLVPVSQTGDSIKLLAFTNVKSGQLTIVGINSRSKPVTIHGSLENLQGVNQFELYYTGDVEDLHRDNNVPVNGKSFKAVIPANCIFTLTGSGTQFNNKVGIRVRPEPAGWYAGDIHVHRNCGDGTLILPESKFAEMMEPNDLAVISVLADMGNGEVKYSKEDLLKVNGKDAPQSKPGRTIHWDTEWHWDATYSSFDHQALGGHLVLLGLKEAGQIWDESPYNVLAWAKKQNAVKGFAHLEYLNDKVQDELNCCIPIDYPVEAAMGSIDFISEDVYGLGSPNNGNYNSEATINAYYKLLNCGFKIGLAAGTDYPCNNGDPLGTLLTYAQVKNKTFSYRQWIDAIRNGRTVVSRNGHNEFLELKINKTYEPGDEINIKDKGTVSIEVKWMGKEELTGAIELVCNGEIIATIKGNTKPGSPLILKASPTFTKSSWICARRMDEFTHQLHTAPVYITVNKKPVRASSDDARYFIGWIDNILKNTAPGGKWERYFTHDQDAVRKRYSKAREIYSKINAESKITNN